MKAIIIVFIFFLGNQWTFAQNIAGRWEGYLDQSKGASAIDGYKEYWERGLWKKGTKTHDLQLTFTYNKQKKRYTGEYYINEAVKKSHFARFAIRASVHSQKVRYSTTSKIFETKNTLNLGFCYNEATLTWSEDDKYEYLQGKWRGWNDQKRACAPAHIWVRRKKRIATPPSPPPTPTPPSPPVVVKKDPPKVKKVTPVPTIDSIVSPSIDSSLIPSKVDSPSIVIAPEPDYQKRTLITKETMHLSKDSIWIDIWDGNREDGDIISLEFNQQLILKNYTLTKQKKRCRVALQKGVNILTLIAHNLGEIPPNTADLEIERHEGKKHLSLESDMDSSESIKIIRE